MQKATLLTLALSVSALFASAQTYEANKVYSIKNRATDQKVYYAAAMPQISDMVVTSSDQLDLSCLFTITPVDGETGTYTIKPYADNSKVVYAIKVANDVNNTVGIKDDDNADNTKWKIANVTDVAGCVSIISASATEAFTKAYWNARGNNADLNLIGIGGYLAGKDNKRSHWTISEVTTDQIAEAVKQFKTNVNSIYTNISDDQIKDQVGYYSQSLIDEVKKNTANATDGIAAYKAVKTFGQLINLPVDGKVYNLYALYSGGNKNYPGGAEGKWVAQKLENNTYKFVNTTADKDGLINRHSDATSYVVSTQERKKFGALTLNNGQYLCVDKNGVVDRLTGGDNNTSHGFSTDFMFEEVSSTNYAGHAVNFTESTDGKAYATLNLPFATTIPTGVTAYKKVDGTESSVKLDVYKNADEVLPANTPVLLQADEAGEKTFAPAAYVAQENTGFSGTLAATTVDAANVYILAKDGKAVKFCKLNATNNKVNANKAYLTLTVAGANALNFDFGGVTTGIENAVADKANNAPIYDLSGRRVMNAVKGGIYIQNGKKFVK
jgi:hypothetical protein